MEQIRVEAVSKAYGPKTVLQAVSFSIPIGQVSCIMAPSGWGKTTLLRILMGLERPDGGRILGLEGLRFSAVFQEDRLCENLNADANIRLTAPRCTHLQVLEAMQAVGLRDCAGQPVRELSGGMRRRVAILRALLADFDVLVLDEPFRGLDAGTKAQVMEDTRQRCAGRTVLMVTHDDAEIAAMGAAQSICFA